MLGNSTDWGCLRKGAKGRIELERAAVTRGWKNYTVRSSIICTLPKVLLKQLN
jgi:hypothetical protein